MYRAYTLHFPLSRIIAAKVNMTAGSVNGQVISPAAQSIFEGVIESDRSSQGEADTICATESVVGIAATGITAASVSSVRC